MQGFITFIMKYNEKKRINQYLYCLVSPCKSFFLQMKKNGNNRQPFI